MFQMVTGYCAVIAIAVVYYAWRDGFAAKARRRAALNDRIAYMLWCAAPIARPHRMIAKGKSRNAKGNLSPPLAFRLLPLAFTMDSCSRSGSFPVWT